jgi:hypothetical protein
MTHFEQQPGGSSVWAVRVHMHNIKTGRTILIVENINIEKQSREYENRSKAG